MNQAQALFQLQKLDLELDARRQRARSITAALQEDNPLRQAEQAVQQGHEMLRPIEARAADLTLEIQSVAGQITQFSDRLYGGVVTIPKELEDLQQKIAERKRHQAQLENELLETMIEVDTLQQTLREAIAHLEQVKSTQVSENQALTVELRRLKTEIVRLKAEREAASEGILPDRLEVYSALRARKHGQAIAQLDDDSCTSCGVSQTTSAVQQVRQGRELVQCESCGRILVAL